MFEVNNVDLTAVELKSNFKMTVTLGMYDGSATVVDYTTVTYTHIPVGTGHSTFNGTWSCSDGFSVYAGKAPKADTVIKPDLDAANCFVKNQTGDVNFHSDNTLDIKFRFMKPFISIAKISKGKV